MSGHCYRNVGRNSLVFLGCTCLASIAFGQRRAEEKLTIPDPQAVTVETSDRISIRCSYYPGGFVEKPGEKKDEPKVEQKPGKEVVPIIMLHGWGGSRRDFDVLASQLQKAGHAIIVPDLRGHGDSSSIQLANGEVKPIDRDRMRPADLAGMLLDVEAAKKFLMDKNNAGDVNIELLCIVGADVGSIIAVNYAAFDWARRQLPAFKQGRDVRALVLISPQESHKGFTLTKALVYPVVQNSLSIMLIVGEQDRTASREAKSIHGRLERQRTVPTDPRDLDLVYIRQDAMLQGTQLINVPGLPLRDYIATFIEHRLARKAGDYPWTERKSPLGD